MFGTKSTWVSIMRMEMEDRDLGTYGLWISALRAGCGDRNLKKRKRVDRESRAQKRKRDGEGGSSQAPDIVVLSGDEADDED